MFSCHGVDGSFGGDMGVVPCVGGGHCCCYVGAMLDCDVTRSGDASGGCVVVSTILLCDVRVCRCNFTAGGTTYGPAYVTGCTVGHMEGGACIVGIVVAGIQLCTVR